MKESNQKTVIYDSLTSYKYSNLSSMFYEFNLKSPMIAALRALLRMKNAEKFQLNKP